MKFINKEGKSNMFFAFIVIAILFISFVMAIQTISNMDSSLLIWDDTDAGNSTKWASNDVIFYANFSYDDGTGAVSDGNCSVRFENYDNTYGDWVNMTFNDASKFFEYTNAFGYKGTFNFDINCSNGTDPETPYFSINVTDTYTISNTEPIISKDAGGWINFDGNTGNHDVLQCTEDTLCYYNFTSNITDPDNLTETFTYTFGDNTTLTNYTLNETHGLLEINITNDNTQGSTQIELKVKDSESVWQSALLDTYITSINDNPVFTNLENKSFNYSEAFEYIIYVTDEEDNFPYTVNITFLSCAPADWSDRSGTNCTLFEPSQYEVNATDGTINISFTPQRNDVGEYEINFTVTDDGNPNGTTSQVVNFTVLNINAPPFFAYVCDEELSSAVEGTAFTCNVNVSDLDENVSLTISSNETWFLNDNVSDCNVTLDYNASALVDFTPTDAEVGNWTINITVVDSEGAMNSTLIEFSVSNLEDIPAINEISNSTIYENTTILVNATDDDLLVSGKIVKNESLTFDTNVSWIIVTNSYSAENYVTARIEVDYDTLLSLGSGYYSAIVNVTDTAGNLAESIFTLQILGDNAVVWDASTLSEINLVEGTVFTWNVSENISDLDVGDTVGSTINFSFENDTEFDSFAINSSTGEISFTPDDSDVGSHNITINASDGKMDSIREINFTVENVNDIPFIETPVSATNASVDAAGSVNATEDNETIIEIWVQDSDFKIPDSMKQYYNETLEINTNIGGPNSTLLEFVYETYALNSNRQYIAYFIPTKSDLGDYNITINVTDSSGASNITIIYMTVHSLEHNLIMDNLENQSSAINRNFYYRINASDIEDGNSSDNENYNFTFTYSLLQGNDLFNETTFNSSTGEINIDLNETNGGIYWINVTAKDSYGNEVYDDFWIHVYDIPVINYPSLDAEFNLNENETFSLQFNATHSVLDNLTLSFYLDDILEYNLSYYGDGTNFSWDFSPNFSHESYENAKNLTLLVYATDFPEISNTTLWNATINHTNSPVEFSGYMGDKQATYDQTIVIDLSNYFTDADYFDAHHNQTVNFTITSNNTASYITATFSGFTMTLSSLIEITELITVNSSDYDNETGQAMTNASSNAFEVQFTAPTTTVLPSGGDSAVSRQEAFKLVVPGEVIMYDQNYIEIPFSLDNTGQTTLAGINLSSMIKLNNVPTENVRITFSEPYITSLTAKQSRNITMYIYADTSKSVKYKATIFANVTSPKLSDWADFFIDVRRKNETEAEKILIFTEKLISENPECLELTESLNEAQVMMKNGEYDKAVAKSEEVINACEKAISYNEQISTIKNYVKDNFYYVSFSTLIILLMGFVFYVYRRVKFNKLRRGDII